MASPFGFFVKKSGANGPPLLRDFSLKNQEQMGPLFGLLIAQNMLFWGLPFVFVASTCYTAPSLYSPMHYVLLAVSIAPYTPWCELRLLTSQVSNVIVPFCFSNHLGLTQVPLGRYRWSFLFMPAIRKRIEARWIKRLKASLNKCTQVWHLFSGYDTARGPPIRQNSI